MKLVRLEKRLLCADMMEVRWVTALGEECTVHALLEDISPDGACLQFEEPLPLGVPVTLHHRDVVLEGEVKYCLYREIGYFAGVQFEEASRWSAAALSAETHAGSVWLDN